MEIDEVSLVDIPANQHSSVEIAKRHTPEEGPMPDQDTFEEISVEDALPGDIIELEDGSVRELTEDDIFELQEAVADFVDSEADQPVGKAWGYSAPANSLADQVRAELSKAFTEGDRDVVIAKMADELVTLRSAAETATSIAKAMADRELEGKYTEVAKNYGIPGVDPEDLGPVLKRFAETADEADQHILAKALASAGSTFREMGSQQAGYADDPMSSVVDALSGTDLSAIGKSFDDMSNEQRVTAAFETNPAAYDAWLRENGS
jgi:hypothetical protein